MLPKKPYTGVLCPFIKTRKNEKEEVIVRNELLRKDELGLYDYVKLRNLILNVFDLFDYLKRKDDKIAIPRITMDYRVRYEQFVPIKSSAVEDCVIKNLMLETELEENRIKLLSKITIALRKLNEMELQVFDEAFYKRKDEFEIAYIICYGYKKVREIRKSACIKFLTPLNLDMQCFK